MPLDMSVVVNSPEFIVNILLKRYNSEINNYGENIIKYDEENIEGIFLPNKLIISNIYTVNKKDIIIYNGNSYEIYKILDYSNWGFYEALCKYID